jgi:hypothetical protein
VKKKGLKGYFNKIKGDENLFLDLCLQARTLAFLSTKGRKNEGFFTKSIAR